MKYYLMENGDIVRPDKCILEQDIARYNITIWERETQEVQVIRMTMDDTATYICKNVGLFKKKTLELKWKPKFVSSKKGCFYDEKKGKAYTVNYDDITLKKE